jgi:6-phosphogluconolactonase
LAIFAVKNTSSMKITGFFLILLTVISLGQGCKSPAPVTVSDSARYPSGTDSLAMVYIGTYTRKEAHVDGKATGVYLYLLHRNTGRLTYAGEAKTDNPSYLTVDTAAGLLYAVNELGSDQGTAGTVSAFRLNGNGNPQYINTVSSGGNYPCYISTDATGSWILAANYGSGTLAVIPSDTAGRLGQPACIIQHRGKGPDAARQEGPHAHMIVPSPDHRFVYACNLGTDEIYVYRLDPKTGTLREAAPACHTLPGAGPRHLAFHPALRIAYVVNELSGTVEVLKTDSLTGALSRLQSVSTLEGLPDQDAGCADIHLTPSGSFLYASNRAGVNNLAVFSVHPLTGLLTPAGHQALPGKTPRSFVIDPSGKFLLVAFQDTGSVATFALSETTGQLTLLSETPIPTPVCLKITSWPNPR